MESDLTQSQLSLTDRFQRFLVEHLSSRSLDSDGDKEKRPDYECLRGLLVVEIKSLEKAAHDRIRSALQDAKANWGFPYIFGKVGINQVLARVPNGHTVSRVVQKRIESPFERIVGKANEQLGSFSGAHKSPVRLLILINEGHAIYDPHSVSDVIMRRLFEKKQGEFR